MRNNQRERKQDMEYDDKSIEEFYRDGKIGLRKDGKVWFEAVYDEIEYWECGFDVIQTVTDGVAHYFDGNHNPILTQWRRFPGIDDDDEPYYIAEKQNMPTLVTMEFSDGPIDSQTCRLDGRLIRLDRMRRVDVRPLFERNSQLQTISAGKLDRFEDEFTYIYSAFSAKARGKDAVRQCLFEFKKMGCFETSWSRLLLVTLSPSRTKPLDVSLLHGEIDDIAGWDAYYDNRWVPDGDFAAGYDESLAPDEIRIFMVQYFWDRAPTSQEWKLWAALESYSLERIEQARNDLLGFARNPANFKNEHQRESFLAECNQPIQPSEIVPPGVTWEDIQAVCEKLFGEGASMRMLARKICELGLCRLDGKNISVVADNVVRLMEWALGRGADPNIIFERQTCLDAVQWRIDRAQSSNSDDNREDWMDLLKRLRALILSAGGKTHDEITRETPPVFLNVDNPAGLREQEIIARHLENQLQ